jgi:hypothetical protein
MIHEVEALLPSSPNTNFRERLVAHLDHLAHLENLEHLKASNGQKNTALEFRQKAGALLVFYEKVFGVKALVDKPDEE